LVTLAGLQLLTCNEAVSRSASNITLAMDIGSQAKEEAIQKCAHQKLISTIQYHYPLFHQRVSVTVQLTLYHKKETNTTTYDTVSQE